MKVTIRKKIVFFMIVISALIVGFLSFFSIQSSTAVLEEQISGELITGALTTMDGIDRFMSERLADIKVFTRKNHPVMSNPDFGLEEKMSLLNSFAQTKGIYNSISIYDNEGVRIGDTRGLSIGKNHKQEAFFKQSIQGNIYNDPRPVFVDELSIPVLRFSGPLYDDEQQTIGVVVMTFPLIKIDELVRRLLYQQNLDAEIELIADNRLVIYSSHHKENILKKGTNLPIFEKTRASDEGIEKSIGLDKHGEGAIFIGVTGNGFLDYKGDGWALIQKIDTDKAFTPVNKLIIRSSIIGGIVLSLVLVLSLLLSATISKPIIKLRDIADKISKGNLNVKSGITSDDEIGQLSTSFDEMTSQLKESRKKSESHNKDLEKEVGKRTEQLHQKVSELEDSKTATINMMEDLQQSLDEQKKLEKIKTEFLSVTSHELRTPITPMKAQLQMVIGEYFGKLDQKQKESLEMVLRNTLRLDRLIGDILDLSKLESGNMKFILAKANLSQVIKEAVETMQLKTSDKSVKLTLKADEVPEFVFDKDRITQVVSNLINNSIKFTDVGGKIDVQLIKEKSRALIKVADSGIGISKEDQDRIFRPFEQVDSSRSRNHEGTGLGLAISMGIVKRHGGNIWVESEEGKGATFIFSVPFVAISKQQQAEVELFKFDAKESLTNFKKKIKKRGFKIVEEKSQELTKKYLSGTKKMRYGLSLEDLEKEGYLKKLASPQNNSSLKK